MRVSCCPWQMPARLAWFQAPWGGGWVSHVYERVEILVFACGTKQLMGDDEGVLRIRRVLSKLDAY